MAEKQCNLIKNGGGMSKLVLNHSVSVQNGTNANVALTTPFNNNTEWVMFELLTGNTTLTVVTIPMERLKQIVSGYEFRLAYENLSNQRYLFGIYYISNSQFHVQGYASPEVVTLKVHSI